MNSKRKKDLEEFQKSIGYTYSVIDLLNLAFTHSSYTNENTAYRDHNERLEFLGDSVVNLVVTDLLYRDYKNLPEGDLTRIRASIICEDSFSKASSYLNIPKYILLGRGEEMNGGRKRKSLMADSFEAFCGSMYLDSNFNTVRNFLFEKFYKIVVDFISTHNVIDYKTMLQEEIQKFTRDKLRYKLIREEGPDHNKTFYFEVSLGSKILGKGKGKSKKEAEHNAAQDSLRKMTIIND